MKKLIFIPLLLILFSVSAQENECSDNSCTIKDAGNYKIELAGCNNYIDIYVYNWLKQPVRGKEITGYVEFYFLDETILTSPFVQYFKTNSLRAKVTGPGFYNFKVSLLIDGNPVVAYFDNECDLRAENKTTETEILNR